MPGIVSGGVLAFARGLGEFGATGHDSGQHCRKDQNPAYGRYSEVAAGNMDAAYRYVAIIVVIAFLSVILMNRAALREKKRRLS